MTRKQVSIVYNEGTFKLYWQENKKVSANFIMYSSLWKEVQTGVITSGQTTSIQMMNLPSGSYWIVLDTPSGRLRKAVQILR